jgi:hypothetical protein
MAKSKEKQKETYCGYEVISKSVHTKARCNRCLMDKVTVTELITTSSSYGQWVFKVCSACGWNYTFLGKAHESHRSELARAIVDPFRANKPVKGTAKIKEKDILQPYHPSGEVNQDFLETYGSKPYDVKERARIEEQYGK